MIYVMRFDVGKEGIAVSCRKLDLNIADKTKSLDFKNKSIFSKIDYIADMYEIKITNWGLLKKSSL